MKKCMKNIELIKYIKCRKDLYVFFVKWHINLCRLFNAKAILLEEQ